MNPQSAAQKLRELGWTDQQIADYLDSSQSVINRARRGARTPSYDVGVGLVAMARKGRKPAKLKRQERAQA